MPLPRMLLGWAISDQIKALCLLAAIVIADRAVDAGAPRRKAYVIAALFGCLVGILLSEPFNWAWRNFLLPDLWPAHRTYLHGTASLFFLPIFALTYWLLIGGSAAFLYADRRAARKTGQLLHAAELDRVPPLEGRARVAAAGDAGARRAAVPVQHAGTGRAALRDRSGASRPHARRPDRLPARGDAASSRNRRSTLGKEVELAQAWLRIVRSRSDSVGRIPFRPRRLHASPGAAIPPMVLLPPSSRVPWTKTRGAPRTLFPESMHSCRRGARPR